MARRREPHRPLTVGSSHWRGDGSPKVRFATQAEALSVAEERGRESGADLVAYRCAFCAGWHLGGRGGRRSDD